MIKYKHWKVLSLAITFFVLLHLYGLPVFAETSIASGETICDDLPASGVDVYTFSGETGDRILIDADVTGGHPYFNVELRLIDPDGHDETDTKPGGDLLDHRLQKTGEYRVLVQATAPAYSGDYCITFINLAGSELTSADDPDGGEIISGATLCGDSNSSDMDAFQFFGNAGDRVLISAASSGGHPYYNTEIRLIDPDQDDATATTPGGDFLSHSLEKTGLYTIVVQDVELDHTGGYCLSLINTVSGPMTSEEDPNGGDVTSGETRCGDNPVSDMDAYRFVGNAGDRVVISAAKSGGHPYYNTEIHLIDPDHEDAAATAAGGDLLNHTLEKTGEYTVIVQDMNLIYVGSYCLSIINTAAGPMTSEEDPNGGDITSGETRCGDNPVSDMDAYRFVGNAGDRVVISAAKSGGHPHYNTEIRLIDPDLDDAADTNPGGDLLNHTLEKTGVYTVIVQDVNLIYAGSYCLSIINTTAGPMTSGEDPNGGDMASGETRCGDNPISDMDAYRFFGNAGDQVLISAAKSGGHAYYNTQMRLIDPDLVDAATTTSSGDLINHQLEKTGVYTVIVHDYNYDHTGNYCLSLLNLNGAVSSPGDCDNGLAESGHTYNGSNLISDMDAYYFYGVENERVAISVAKTGGHAYYHTETVLIDPDKQEAVPPVLGTTPLDHVLEKTGLYMIVVRDFAFDHPGSYNITLNKLSGMTSAGIYDPAPNADCNLPTQLTLEWEPVANATGYDVYLGSDTQAPLVQVGTNVPQPSLQLTGLDTDTVYYWKVIAHTPAGQVMGTDNWFITRMLCDMNNDCSCNIVDWPIFAEDWGSSSCNEPDVTCECDLNQDGSCNILDYPYFIQSWGMAVCQ